MIDLRRIVHRALPAETRSLLVWRAAGDTRECPARESHVACFLLAGMTRRSDARYPVCGNLERHPDGHHPRRARRRRRAPR